MNYLEALEKAYVKTEYGNMSLGHIFGWAGSEPTFRNLQQTGAYGLASSEEKERVRRYFSANGEFNPGSSEIVSNPMK